MAKIPNDRREGDEVDFTERVLLSLVFDVTCLSENVEQVKVKIFAMCRDAGIEPPKK